MRASPRLAAALAAACALACGCGDAPRNALVLVLDTTRADAVGAYREGAAYTPTLDALAAAGVVFTNARSTSAWTVPAHGSLFTGLFPSRHGAHGEHAWLAPEQLTLAELLAATHETAGFSENPHIVRAKGYAQGFEVFEETWRRRRSVEEEPITLELVEAWLGRRDTTRPFFLFVNLMTPHLPYRPPARLRARFLPEGVSEQAAERYTAVGEREARLYMTVCLSRFLGR